MNNNKIKLIIGIGLLLIATTSFAVFLEYYVKAEGSSEVSPPEFYIDSPLSEKLLIVNEKSPSCENFEIGGSQRTFKTEELGGVSFTYLPKVNFYIRASGINTVSTSTPAMRLGFGYYKTSDPGESVPIYLAETDINLSNTLSNHSLPFVNASAKPTNIRRFFYEFEKLCPECSYQIETCGGSFYTKVKLTE
jgi:hypothetical protein